MKTWRGGALILATLLLSGLTRTQTLEAQHAPVALPGTELRTLHSEAIGQDFELYVKLPRSYHHSDATYPVLFTLDGNRSFPLFSTMSLIYETPGSGNPEIVVVGIGYRVDQDPLLALADWSAWRTRDLTPEPAPESEAYWEERLSALPGGEEVDVRSGGGPAFLEFIRARIIPFIESNYRVSTTDRGLAGYSLGGLFTLYALFEVPETFQRYFAGDPSVRDHLFDQEAAVAATRHDLRAKVVLTTTGAGEQARRLVDRLRSRAYSGLDVDLRPLQGESHSSGYAASVSLALRLLYDLEG